MTVSDQDELSAKIEIFRTILNVAPPSTGPLVAAIEASAVFDVLTGLHRPPDGISGTNQESPVLS